MAKNPKFTGTEAKKLDRARNQLRAFKTTVRLTNGEVARKSGVPKTEVNEIFSDKELPKTRGKRKWINKIARAYHVSKDWLYEGIGSMMIDTEKLTQTEIYLVDLATDAKREAFINRFEESRKIKALTKIDIASLLNVKYKTFQGYYYNFLKWNNENGIKEKKFVDVAIAYCQKLEISQDWLFYGKGDPPEREAVKIAKPEPEFETVKNKVSKKFKKWYLVNSTEVHYDGWRIIPNGFQIKRAYSAAEVAKNYPPKRVTVGKYVDDIIRSERAIGSYRTKADALEALERESQRIKRDGTDAWIAPWAKEVIR